MEVDSLQRQLVCYMQAGEKCVTRCEKATELIQQRINILQAKVNTPMGKIFVNV